LRCIPLHPRRLTLSAGGNSNAPPPGNRLGAFNHIAQVVEPVREPRHLLGLLAEGGGNDMNLCNNTLIHR